MTKKYIVITGIQTVIVMTSILFAFLQKTKADRAVNAAEYAYEEIEKMRELAALKKKDAHEAAARCDSLLKIQNRK